MGGAGENHADEASDLETADALQHVEPVRTIGLIDGERATNDVHLARPGGGVDSRTTARHHIRVGAGHRSGDRARRRRVADAHLAGDEQIGALIDRRLGQRGAALDRGDRLRRRHRRASRHVCGPACDRTIHEAARSRNRAGDTEIRDDDTGPGMAHQDVDGRAAGEKVLHHLRGHDLGIRADPLADHAVVGGEHEDDRVLDTRRSTSHGGQSRRDLFESSETTRGLRQLIEVATRPGVGVHRRRDDGVTEPAEHFQTSLRLGPPAL